MKAFWSWQSDVPGRHFIRKALDGAVSDLKEADDISEPVRDELHLDSDRQGVAGSPDLASLILQKIDDSFVLIADVTLVGWAEKEGHTGQRSEAKRLINPNVAIELGYGLKSLGSEGLIMVMNDHYGSREHLPFDLRAKAGPILFTLAPDASDEEKARQKKLLRSQLRDALALCLVQYSTRLSLQREQDAKVSTTTRSDWEELASRFAQSCQNTRADSQREFNVAKEEWRFAGSVDPLCTALLRKAGVYLSRSPKVLIGLPNSVRDEDDPVIRWFEFLKVKGHHEARTPYFLQDENGLRTGGGVLGSINRLSYVSRVVCEECAIDEL